jgi:hypothetical protein
MRKQKSMKVSDLVKVNKGSPYMGKYGIIKNIDRKARNVYYYVLLLDEDREIPFRSEVLELADESG